MSHRLSSFRCLCGGVAFSVGVAVWTVQAADGPAQPGQSIEFSDPGSSTRVTNVNQLGEKAHSMRYLEGNSIGTESFSPLGGSLTGMLPPPPASGGAAVNNREKDLFDSGNSVLFRTPEETLQRLLVKDLLKLPDLEPNGQNNGLMQQPAPSMERFYERLLDGRPQMAGQPKYYDSFGSRNAGGYRSGSSELEESRSPWGAADTLSSKNLPGSDLNSRFSPSSTRPDSLSDLFGLHKNRREDDELSPEKKREDEAMKKQLDDYRTLLGSPSSPLEGFGSVASPARPNPWSGGSSALPTVLDNYGIFGAMRGTFANSALSPPIAPVAPLPSSLAPVPYTPPPNRTQAPKPIFTVPQRAF
jgi:hypothetical protein